MNREPEGDGKGGRQTLVSTGWLFAGGSAIHVVDHLRRGQGSVTEELYWLGTTALVMQVVLVVLAVTRHRLAPLVAVAIGYPLALGFLAAHWLPEWSALSDPVSEIDSWAWLSVVASIAEIAGGLAVATAGLVMVRRQGLASFALRAPGPRRAVRPST